MSIIEQSFPIMGAREIVLEGRGEIELVQGEPEMLVIRTEDFLLPKLKSEVQGQRLALGFRSLFDHLLQAGHPPIHYRVTVRDPRALAIAGSGSLTSQRISAESLRLSISGSGKIRLDEVQSGPLEIHLPGSGQVECGAQAGDALVKIPGSGSVRLHGSAQHVEVKISGSGSLEAAELPCQAARVSISGSGQTSLAVSETLEVSISGSGSVRYSGAPALQTRISGSGRVSAL